jgi:hypothetical protein
LRQIAVAGATLSGATQSSTKGLITSMSVIATQIRRWIIVAAEEKVNMRHAYIRQRRPVIMTCNGRA